MTRPKLYQEPEGVDATSVECPTCDAWVGWGCSASLSAPFYQPGECHADGYHRKRIALASKQDKTMDWNINKAKAWMLQTGMDHIHDGLYAEGGELVYEANWGDGCDSKDNFYRTMMEVCCWDNKLIDDAVKSFQ